MTTPRPLEKPRVPTVHKVGRLLRAFTTQTPSWGVNALARHLGWDAATTHRLLKALVDIGLLDFDGHRHRVGPLAFELSAIALSDDPARAELLRWLEELSNEAGLTTQIGVFDAGEVAILASHESRAPLKAAANLGARLPLHATAAGKAILMQHTDEQIVALLPPRLELFTDQTIVDRDVLLAQIRDARTAGFAGVNGEMTPGLDAVAIPIPPGRFGSSFAALTCIGVSRLVSPAPWQRAEAALLEKAALLSPTP